MFEIGLVGNPSSVTSAMWTKDKKDKCLSLFPVLSFVCSVLIFEDSLDALATFATFAKKSR